MTPPPDPSELASALLDGALPDDEAAAAAADPEVAALAEELRALRTEIRALPPAPDLGRATAVAAALDALAQDTATAYGPVQGGTLPPPAQFPLQATPRTRRPWLVAAASIVALVLAVGLITRLGDGDDSEDLAADETDENADTSTGAADDFDAVVPDAAEEEFDAEAQEGASGEDEAEDGGRTQEDESVGDGGAPEAEAEADVPEVLDLGTVDSADQLVGVVREHYSGDAPVPSLDQADILRGTGECPAYGPGGDPVYGTSDLTGLALLDDEPVWVHLYLAPPDQADVGTLMAFNESCERVLNRTVDL